MLWYSLSRCRRPEQEDTMAKFFTYAERISLQKFLGKGLSFKEIGAHWVRIRLPYPERSGGICRRWLQDSRATRITPVSIASPAGRKTYVAGLNVTAHRRNNSMDCRKSSASVCFKDCSHLSSQITEVSSQIPLRSNATEIPGRYGQRSFTVMPVVLTRRAPVRSTMS